MILVAPPVAEEIADDPVFPELAQEDGEVVGPQALDERAELTIALLDGLATGLEDGAAFGELW